MLLPTLPFQSHRSGGWYLLVLGSGKIGELFSAGFIGRKGMRVGENDVTRFKRIHAFGRKRYVVSVCDDA